MANRLIDFPTANNQRRQAFARILLEVTLVMVFVMIISWSPGSNNSNKRLDIKSATDNTHGQEIELAHTTLLVTSEGYILDGEQLNKESLLVRLADDGNKLLRVEPGETMHEKLHWLLANASETHEIQLQLTR